MGCAKTRSKFCINEVMKTCWQLGYDIQQAYYDEHGNFYLFKLVTNTGDTHLFKYKTELVTFLRSKI